MSVTAADVAATAYRCSVVIVVLLYNGAALLCRRLVDRAPGATWLLLVNVLLARARLPTGSFSNFNASVSFCWVWFFFASSELRFRGRAICCHADWLHGSLLVLSLCVVSLCKYSTMQRIVRDESTLPSTCCLPEVCITRTTFFKFWDASISRERFELETSNLARRLITGGTNDKNDKLCQRGSGRGQG